MAEKKKEDLGFKYERKRIKKDKKLPLICPDYKAEGSFGNCEKAKVCKNATYGRQGEAWGSCYGGAKSSEMEHRRKYFTKT